MAVEVAFPKGFLWGSATSAHQVEGGNIHSDWWAWEQAGRVTTKSGPACDHYRRYPQDFDLAQSLGHNVHRFSVEWSRVEPDENVWNDEALAHYADVARALRTRGLEPIVTLHHFTTPQWLVAQGGWTNSKSVSHFAHFARRVAHALRGQVRYWITINEPMVYVRMHYVQGLGPPGEKSLSQALRAVEHLIHAHAAAYHLLHTHRAPGDPAPMVSIAHNIPEFWPCHRWSPLDRWVTWLTNRIFTEGWIGALTEGRWSVPGIGRWHYKGAENTLDYLGINYYGRQFIHWVPPPNVWPGDGCDLGHHPTEVIERTSMGWDVHPQSLFKILMKFSALKLPMLITENGASMEDDAQRWSFIQRHLQAVACAVQQGAPVAGYCYWSLMDNFEWADGYGPRFGIVEVDFATQERTPRPSARKYAELIRANRITV